RRAALHLGSGSETRARPGVIGILSLLLAATISAADDANRSIPPDEERFISPPLPNVALTTATRVRTDLQTVAAGPPLLWAFVLSRCAGVCSPFRTSWRAADAQLRRRPEVHRLVLSFDPRDTASDMAATAHHLGADTDSEWTFAVAAAGDIRRLASAVGF